MLKNGVELKPLKTFLSVVEIKKQRGKYLEVERLNDNIFTFLLLFFSILSEHSCGDEYWGKISDCFCG